MNDHVQTPRRHRHGLGLRLAGHEGRRQVLKDFGVPFEARVVSAHRTPDLMFDYASMARDRGLKAIIAGAGGAAHLPGMLAAKTSVPVLAVPVQSKAPVGQGLPALHRADARRHPGRHLRHRRGRREKANAALFAVAMLALSDKEQPGGRSSPTFRDLAPERGGEKVLAPIAPNWPAGAGKRWASRWCCIRATPIAPPCT
jgi:phosphoribosylcarboxyaminoimidazole (NCAIR) mutase